MKATNNSSVEILASFYSFIPSSFFPQKERKYEEVDGLLVYDACGENATGAVQSCVLKNTQKIISQLDIH